MPGYGMKMNKAKPKAKPKAKAKPKKKPMRPGGQRGY